MNPELIAEMVMEMSILPYFPAEDYARLAIVRLVGAMADTEAQVRWLVDVMTSGVYARWDGPSELRATYCQKFRPKDGIECVSLLYPDGLTREQLNPGVRLTAVPIPFLRSGSEDPEMDALVAQMGRGKRL